LTAVLLDIAEKCGLDGDELEQRLYEGWYTRQTNRDKMEAISLGITGIPAYIIGNYLVQGARPYETFQLAMELQQRPQSGSIEKISPFAGGDWQTSCSLEETIGKEVA